MMRKMRFILCVAVLFLLQVTVVPRFSYPPCGGPDLLLLAAAFLALEADFATALWGAFTLGLLKDLGSAAPLGVGPLLLVPTCAALNLLKDHLVRESAWTDLALTFAYVLACGMVHALAMAAFTAGGAAQLVPRALGQAAFTTALSPLVFLALTKLRLLKSATAA